MAIDTTGISNGEWSNNNYESEKNIRTSEWGMIYRSGAHLNERVNTLANELQKMLSDKTNEMDNPTTLAKISALNGHYNGVRQAQSNIMKSIKDTSQAIIRNM
ncbi:MAG: EscF/YscF/HrpA family type III secretion system needle major subunit [Yersinia sp. (in: enterobacteria)]|jgi:type III secretion protein F